MLDTIRSRSARAGRRVFGLRPPPGGVVLVYHRIAELASDPQCLAVSPQHFAEHLAAIAKHGVPLALPAMLQQARAGSLPPRAVAVTFDDGYADNFHAAAPMLAAAGVPATMFVSTSAVARGEEFWWDRIERLVLDPGPLADGATAAWNVTHGHVPTPRHRAYLDLCDRLRRVNRATRERLLAELPASGSVPREPRASHRPMTRDEVAALGRRAGITIGSHTESHPSLAHLTADEQRSEIARARDWLRSVTGVEASSLAYPFGGHSDVVRRTVQIAREEGLAIACTTSAQRVTSHTDPLQVPRFIVRDWSSAAFIQQWSLWAGMEI